MFEKSAGRQFNFLTQMQLQTVKIVQTDALSQCFVDFLPVLSCFSGTNLNLYHYAGNKPVKYTDLDGRKQNLAQKVFAKALNFAATHNEKLLPCQKISNGIHQQVLV